MKGVSFLVVTATAAVLAVGFYRMHEHQLAAVEASRAVEVKGSNDSLAEAKVVPRAFYGRRLEPRESVILHGVGQSEEASYTAYTRAVAPAKPMLLMRYVDLHEDIPKFFAGLRSDLAEHADLLIPQIGVSMNAGSAEKHYESAVASGAEDPHLRQLCDGLRSLQRPAFVRLGYEFNAPWNGYEPAAYAAAFRHAAAVLHACGDVAMVWDWSPGAELDREHGGAPLDEAATRWQSYYPGDAYVDWWALNLFTPESIEAPVTRQFLHAAEQHRFPVMIAESSPRGASVDQGEASVRAWFAPYFGLLRSQPGIKAFCYIDWDWRTFPQWADWGDARIEHDEDVLRFYRSQVVGSPLFADARSRAETLQLLRVARQGA